MMVEPGQLAKLSAITGHHRLLAERDGVTLSGQELMMVVASSPKRHANIAMPACGMPWLVANSMPQP
jgi:hypothetical protein